MEISPDTELFTFLKGNIYFDISISLVLLSLLLLWYSNASCSIFKMLSNLLLIDVARWNGSEVQPPLILIITPFSILRWNNALQCRVCMRFKRQSDFVLFLVEIIGIKGALESVGRRMSQTEMSSDMECDSTMWIPDNQTTRKADWTRIKWSS